MREYIGIKRCIDDTGRIVIPKEFRTEFGIETGDELEIRLAVVDGQKVIEIRKK